MQNKSRLELDDYEAVSSVAYFNEVVCQMQIGYLIGTGVFICVIVTLEEGKNITQFRLFFFTFSPAVTIFVDVNDI